MAGRGERFWAVRRLVGRVWAVSRFVVRFGAVSVSFDVPTACLRIHRESSVQIEKRRRLSHQALVSSHWRG